LNVPEWVGSPAERCNCVHACGNLEVFLSRRTGR
jgi:hypothetical protein